MAGHVFFRAVWCGLLLALLASQALAAGPSVLQVRYSTTGERTRVVLDLSRPGAYEIKRVGNPERLAVNVLHGRFRNTGAIAVNGEQVRRIRRNDLTSKAQVVLDLTGDLPFRHFSLPAADGRPDRIVVDVYPRWLNKSGRTDTSRVDRMESSATAQSTRPPTHRPNQTPTQRPAQPSPRPAKLVADPDGTTKASPAQAPRPDQPAPAPQPVPTKPFTVVLDPGHGGSDPGAIRSGIQEKNVVLKVCRAAARLLNETPGYKAVLTRDSDYTLSLGSRKRRARRAEGDIFLSIHCNTHPKSSTSGMEIYLLSLKGATDREARELANKENAADIVGIEPATAPDDEVLAILMDLRMAQVLKQSARLADQIMIATRQGGTMGTRHVKQARFVVLSSLAMPSALVELGYLSNRKDRKFLASQEGIAEMARAVVCGIFRYREDKQVLAALSPLDVWTREYTVRRGDSLWKLAKRYGTTIGKIRQENQLSTSRLLVGQTLRLPAVD
jgi:N-acetylmuramoyl-L-alanine amidase